MADLRLVGVLFIIVIIASIEIKNAIDISDLKLYIERLFSIIEEEDNKQNDDSPLFHCKTDDRKD